MGVYHLKLVWKHEAGPHTSFRQEVSGQTCQESRLSRCCPALGSTGLPARGAAGLPARPLPPDVVQAQLGPRRDPQHGHLTECRACCGPLLMPPPPALRPEEGARRAQGPWKRSAAIMRGAS